MKSSQSIGYLLVAIAATVLLATGCFYDRYEDMYPANSSTCDTTNVTYSGSVAPLMSTYCTGCHGANSPSAGIDLSSYTALKSYLDASEATFYSSIIQDGQASAMPQGGSKMTDCNIRKIKIWLDAGKPNN